jgi:DNA processing protein
MTALTEDPRLARVALTCLVEPGHRDLGQLVDAHGPVEALLRVLRGDVGDRLLGAVEARRRESKGDFVGLAERALEATERLGARIVTPEDDDWPAQLGDLRRISRDSENRLDRDTYPPLCVWLRGATTFDGVAQRSVAIVGSRASTPYGNHVALEFAYGLAERGWTVVSGGAYGIDAQAHRGALGPGGATIAVLASGIDKTYPMAHAALFERIAEYGLLLSEWPPGADPHRHRFLIRNRVIAALTRGAVVVEASARSGAKQTAGRARALGRALMAVPGPITSAMSVGTTFILREMQGRAVSTVEEVLEEVGRIGEDLAPIPYGPKHPRDELDPALAQVLDGIPAGRSLEPGQIAAAAGVSLRAVLRALPVLRDGGFAVEDGGAWRLGTQARARAKRGRAPTV